MYGDKTNEKGLPFWSPVRRKTNWNRSSTTAANNQSLPRATGQWLPARRLAGRPPPAAARPVAGRQAARPAADRLPAGRGICRRQPPPPGTSEGRPSPKRAHHTHGIDPITNLENILQKQMSSNCISNIPSWFRNEFLGCPRQSYFSY